MQNIDVRFNATSNFGKVKADLAALQAQAASLSAVFNKGAYATAPALVDPAAWKAGSRAVHEASGAFRAAASSSGLFNTQQIRATSEAERYTKSLQKQKLALGDMRKHQGIMKEVYRDQLRYQRMTAQYWGTDSAGRAITDITVPKNVPKDLDTAAQKLHFFGQMSKSAGTQIVNMGKNMQWAGRQLTVGFTYPVALFGAAAGVMAYKVDEAMTRVTKVYDVSAEAMRNEAMRTKELNEVRAESWKISENAAKDYGMRIEDTLEIEQRLAATGLKGEDLFGGTKEVARIATLGDLDIGQATDMTIALKNAFGQTNEELSKTFNYMNAVENATSLSLQDIAEATPRAASGLAALGVNAKEMTVMLVAMREKGVEAAEGANALKSATTRILNPVNKASEYYKQFGINLEGISKESGGNLFEFLQLLATEQTKMVGNTEKETNRLRQKGIASLFGTYQFNRLNAALVGVGDAMTGTAKAGSQTAKAWDLMNASAEETGNAAERELAQKMEAASGKFKAAWQELRVEIAKMGEPFLKVATIMANAAGNVAEFFNGMADWKKKAVLGVAAIMAIAGPVVMLGGLFMNLGGQFMTGSGRIMAALGRLGGARALVTKEEQAAILTAEAQNKAMMTSQSRTATLAQEVNVLTAAYEKATIAAKQYALSQGVAGAASGAAAAGMIGPQTQTLKGKGFSQPYQLTSKEQGYYSATSAQGANGRFLSQETRLMQARNKMAADYMRANNQVARDATRAERSIAAQARATAAVKNNLSGAAISGGVMAASMAVMMTTSNETANSIAKWAMVGALVVPMLASTAGWMGKVAKDAWAAAAGNIANARAAATGAGATGALSVAMGTARGAAIGFGTALNTALGPIGWIALGLTAVVGTFMIIKNHQDKIKEEQAALVKKQVEANDALMNSSASIATNLGKAAGSYKQIVNAGGTAQSGQADESQMLKAYNYYKGEEGSKEVDALKMVDFNDTDAIMTKIRSKFIDLQVLGSDTAEQARDDIQGMLLAAGMSAADAQAKAQEVYKTYGDVSKIDWAGPIKDQTDALTTMAGEAFKLNTTMVTSGGMATILTDFEIDEGKKQLLYQQAEKSAEIFNQALANAATPEDANAIIEQYMSAATAKWDTGFESLMAVSDSIGGADKVKDLFAQYGIDSGEAFAAAMREDGAFEKAYSDLTTSPRVNANLAGQMKYIKEFAIEYEHSFVNPLAKSSWYLSDGVMTAMTALEQFKAAGIGLDADEAADALLSQNDAYLEYAAIQEQINNLMRSSNGRAANSKEMLDLQNKLNKSGKDLTRIINELNQQYGFKQGKNATEALNYLLNKTKAEAKGAGKEVDNINKKLDELPTQKTVTIKMKQVGGIVQSAMSAVQGRMADSAMDSFNEGWDARMDGAQASWDNRMDNMTASHERASDAMDRRQDAAQEAFDNRWEARKKAVEQEYQKKIDRVNREIAAEQRADEIRAGLFEKEKARLAALAEASNTDIDFNTQLNEGKLDEAAKTLNNAGVASGNAQMDAEQKAAEARTATRIKALEKKNERLEKARDKELENLNKLEERMRKHLERVQDARRKALESQQADETKALEKSEAAAMKSLEKQRDYDEAMLEERLELFKSYTARNQKDLEKWMKEVGLSYDDFGDDVKAKGESWSKYFRTELASQIRKAGTEVMNDNIWENVGKGIANKLLKGLGFENLASFNRFVKTGSKDGKGGKGGAGDVETRHEGGVIGSGSGSRGSIPNTYKGLHRSEKMVRAQKGEYMINRKAAKKNLGLLDAINKGSDVAPPGVGGMAAEGGGARSTYGGPVGMLAGAIGQMFKQGVTKAFNNNYQVGLAKQAKLAGPGGKFAGDAGTYGGRSFTAEQMKNAATIASVGSSMGMSSRDIQIGIMTAIAESGLVNIHGGDRDSQGLFQQRPSMGWGTVAQVTDPKYAARAFFTPLKAHGERTEETPWLAAQHIQRSAFADGSNYQRWWEAAQQIFSKGLTKKAGVDGGYVAGSGGKHRPIANAVTNGLHGGSSAGNPPAVDMATGTGVSKPVYAVANGVITSSRDIAGPLSTDSYRGDGPYGSFGRVIQMQTDDGHGILYGHLKTRSVATGQRVKGGARIGYSGNTGNSSGDHLHFGATNGPYAWLRKGGTIKHDETPAMLHRGETVLTDSLTRQFKDNVASGTGDGYNVTIDLRGAYIKEDVDIEKAVNVAIDRRESKVGRKRVVK